MSERRTTRDERLTEAFASPRWEDARSEQCIDSRQIWNAACNRASRQAMDTLLEHVGDCAFCAHDFRAARELAGEMGEIEEVGEEDDGILARHVAKPRPTAEVVRDFLRWIGHQVLPRGTPVPAPSVRLQASAVPISMFAMCMVVALGTMLAAVHLSQGPVATRGASDSAQGEEHGIELWVEEDQSLEGANPVLRWKGVEGVDLEGARFSVFLDTEYLDPVWTWEDEEQEVTLPDGILTDFAEGTVLLCRVTADLADGTRVDSRTHRLTLE